MIFVTVGTHEQPFNRLIKAVDDLVADGTIQEEVIIQRGYSTYEPKHCKYYDLISWEDMQKYNKEARIIITHGGPASFIDILALGKTPIVVPRQSKFGEHVNDHQLEFCNALAKRGFPLIVIDEISELEDSILNYNNFDVNYKGNNETFCLNLKNELKKIM